jgi:hypothetical protein
MESVEMKNITYNKENSDFWCKEGLIIPVWLSQDLDLFTITLNFCPLT